MNAGENLFAIHNFIDCARLRANPDAIDSYFGQKDGRPRVFLAAALVFYKGIRHFLLEVVKKRGERSLNIVVAGDAGGGIKAELEKEFNNDVAKFVGWLSYEETIGVMRACDSYVLSSLVEESCSTTVLESLYLGKDVRGLRRGGTPELAAYACNERQMKLYENTEEMADSLIQGDIFRKSGEIAADSFSADVAFKAHEIRKIYDL
jgi:glycosyltransferase involved in cell wall biosynthesis